MNKTTKPVYQRLLEKALEDQKITEDEYEILETVRINYGIYSEAFNKAIADRMIGEKEAEHLKQIRIKMYEDALIAALKDGVITNDEQALLDTLKSCIDLDVRSIVLIESVLMKK